MSFTGLASAESGTVADGETASITASGLLPGTLYHHWRVRAVDETGRNSDGTSFGDNAESDPDFGVPLL